MREEILALYEQLRRRLRWVRGVDLFFELAFIVSIPVAMILLLDRLLLETGWTKNHLAPWALTLMASAFAFALLLTLVISLSRRISVGEIGLLTDQSVGGEERFLSALEMVHAGGSNPFRNLVLKEASRLHIEPVKIICFPKIRYRWGSAIALGAVFLLELYPPMKVPPPHADFSLSVEAGPAPLEIECFSRHQGPVRSIEWDFGDGEQNSGQRSSHIYARPGNYVVRQTVHGPGGSAYVEKKVRVVPVKTPWARFEALPEKGRAPLHVVFRNQSRNGKTYLWEFGDGNTSVDENPENTFSKPGTYAVRLQTSNGRTTHETEGSIKVVGPDAPLTDFRAHPRTGEAPLSVSFENLSTGEIGSWKWDFGNMYAGDKRYSRETNPVHVFRFPGTYTIRLRSVGPGGEDTEEKEAYIRVGESGGGSGGGGGSKKPSAKEGGQKQTGPGEKEGKLFGKRTLPKKIKIDPVLVTSPAKESEKTIREQWVWSGQESSPGNQEPGKLKQLFPAYERTLEKTMGKERVPPPVREYVKKYFEQIRPK